MVEEHFICFICKAVQLKCVPFHDCQMYSNLFLFHLTGPQCTAHEGATDDVCRFLEHTQQGGRAGRHALCVQTILVGAVFFPLQIIDKKGEKCYPFIISLSSPSLNSQKVFFFPLFL